MSDFVQPTAQDLDDLDVKMGSTDYATAHLHLYSNDLTPTPLTPIGDFVEVNAAGVVDQAVTWSSAFFDGAGIAISTSGQLLFVQSGSPDDTCYGIYLTDAAGTKLLGAARLDDAPFNFTGAGTTLPLVLNLKMEGGELIKTA